MRAAIVSGGALAALLRVIFCAAVLAGDGDGPLSAPSGIRRISSCDMPPVVALAEVARRANSSGDATRPRKPRPPPPPAMPAPTLTASAEFTPCAPPVDRLISR